MKRNYILGGLLSVFLVGALVYYYGGSEAPSAQPPLETVTAQNLSDVKSQFNATKDDVRVLLLLSPT